MKQRTLIDRYQSAEAVYHLSGEELRQSGLLSEKDLAMLEESRRDLHLYEEYQALKEQEISFISYCDPRYPSRLKEIYDHPYGLYCKGRMLPDHRPVIAIVGSRACSSYGRQTAYEFAYQFAKMGFIVISGMAVGIDAAAHQGCLDGQGMSYAVLGCGVDICYPRSNIELYMDLVRCGGILSENCPGTQPFPGLFPLRNRIISGMADLVIVVEARKKSGSLITVDQALEQNRDVMVVPGRISDKLSEGCNNLIRMGAQMIATPQDVLENYTIASLLSDQKAVRNDTILTKNIPNDSNFLQDNGKNSLAREKNLLYSCLNLDPKSLDQILIETKLNITIVNQILLELQIEGVIEEVSKNSYIRSYM